MQKIEAPDVGRFCCERKQIDVNDREYKFQGKGRRLKKSFLGEKKRTADFRNIGRKSTRVPR